MISLDQRFQKTRELTFNYGNKGNEELLFLYGFVLEMNTNDTLRIRFGASKNANSMIRRNLKGLFMVELPGIEILSHAEAKFHSDPREAINLIPQNVWSALEQFHEMIVENEQSKEPLTTKLKVQMLRTLLEQQKDDLEGEKGTGSLEDDLKILTSKSQPRWLQNACIYRSMQKSLTRKWLKVIEWIESNLEDV